MKSDSAWFTVISDLFVNLSAGWLGVAFIVPNFSAKKPPLRYVKGTLNFRSTLTSQFS